MIVFRHADTRFPFLWEGTDQPAGRWNRADDGPVQYCADTPDGAWAEFLRHEGITTEQELRNVRRALWAIEVPDDLKLQSAELPAAVLTGGMGTYAKCQAEAERLRGEGAPGLRVPSAALREGGARGWQVQDGVQPAAPRDGFSIVLFGTWPEVVGWPATIAGRPQTDLLSRVRPL